MTEVMKRRIGWTLSGLFGLFMLGASVAPKLMGMPVAQETMAALGWPDAPLMLIGALELICTLLFLFPPTGLLGAVLMWAIWRGGWLRAPGRVTGVFLAGYGLARFAVEFVRQPDAQFVAEGNPLGLALNLGGYGLTMGQILSLPMILAGLWFILRSGWETKRCQMTAWKASLCGVMLAGFTVGTMTQALACLATSRMMVENAVDKVVGQVIEYVNEEKSLR